MTTTADLARRFRLVLLTKEELKVQTKADDYAMWGAPKLTLEQYLHKEALQRATPFSQRGSIFWALVERRTPLAAGDDVDDDTSDDDVVAGRDAICVHCESHRFDCVVQSSQANALVRGFSHHIGSVFTLPAYRKQGLASFFLRSVAAAMANLPQAVASVLYSDIGPTFYDNLGWRLHPSTVAKLRINAPRNAAAIATSASAKSSNSTSLYLDAELDALLARDTKRLEADVGATSSRSFALLATRDSIEWQFCIGVYYADIFGYPQPLRCGVCFADDAFVVWCHNFKEATLYIVRLRLPRDGDRSNDAAVLLLQAALVEAQAFGLECVVLWNPPRVVVADDSVVKMALDVDGSERTDSLSSAMVFGNDDSRVEDSSDKEKQLPLWLANEKFAWV